jgi:translocation and assembly module TamA
MPGVDWTRYRGDNALRPTNGARTSFELRGGSDAIGSETNVAQFIASTKWIHSLANDGRILLRGTLGVTAVDDFSVLPPSMRFFTGGDNSIRGYKFESLGPTNANDQVIGGSRLAVASFEYERPVKPMWSVAFFVDVGNAFSDKRIDARKSAGIGARWLSPLGPIRIDIGVPVNDPEHGPRLHVSLGPDL